tara:strand:- start:23 stop:595 length:573 start_codon:yes stop_codon:yes gene_type:complete
MAHFAQLDDDNNILQVIVISNDDILNDEGNEDESVGIAYCQNLFGNNTTWIQTSYNANLRGNYAEVGGSYDSENDIFKPVKPFPSWVWNNETLNWEAPMEKPEGVDDRWGWNENKYNETNDGWEELYTYPTWIQNKIWVWNIDLQVFEAIQPYPSWTQNENGLWQAPVEYPSSGDWDWSENQLQWIEYTP